MRALAIVALVGCSFEGRSATGIVDAPPMIDDSGREILAWTFDTYADFTKPGFAGVDVAIQQNGSLTEAAYIQGALLIHGIHGMKLWNANDATFAWDKIDTVTAGGAGLYDGLYMNESARLQALGVPTNDMYSLWIEGEVYLDAGDYIWVDCDNVCFVEVENFGAPGYQLVVRDDSNMAGATTSTMTAPAAGWYAIRLGFSEGNSAAHLDFRHGDAGGANPFARRRMRMRADRLQGTLREVFSRQIFGALYGNEPLSHFDEIDHQATTTFTPLPAGTITADDWSARWAGQFHVDAPGNYTFTVTSDDGNRIWFGDVPVATSWQRNSENTAAVTTQTVALAAGWNEFYVDYNQRNGAADLKVEITDAPDPALIGNPIPRTRLRPVQPPNDRLVFGLDLMDRPIVTQTTASIKFPAFTNEVVTAVDVTIDLTHDKAQEVGIALQPPSGPSIRLCAAGQCASGNFSGVVQRSVAVASIPATGSWRVVLNDTATGNDGVVQDVYMTLHTSGGPNILATEAMWTSEIRDLGGSGGTGRLSVIDGVRWIERAPMPSEIEIRACDQPDCTDGTWTAVVADTPIDLGVKRYMQVRARLRSDGTRESELDSLVIDYRRYP